MRFLVITGLLIASSLLIACIGMEPHRSGQSTKSPTPLPSAAITPWTIPTSTPTPIALSEDRKQEILRTAIASLLADTLREHGCQECGALPVDDSLHIWNPDLSPNATATRLLSDKKAVKVLKRAGFKTLVVSQGTSVLSGPRFSYPIK